MALYIPIPKVACSTLKAVCADLLDLESPTGELAEEIHKLDFPCVNRTKIRTQFCDYFVFAFVRNPWSRLLSCYNDKLNYEAGHVYDRYHNAFVDYLRKEGLFKETLSFDEFVKVVCSIPDEMADGHIRSQYLFLQDSRGYPLAQFVGRFESLEDDFDYVASRLGICVRLPHVRRGRGQDYRAFYSQQSAELVADRYREDIRRFGYCFDGVKRREESVCSSNRILGGDATH